MRARLLRLGERTLAPWDPPKRLVVVGLYRYVRNPMYVGLLLFILGWALVAGSRALGIYTAGLAIAFHLRVVTYEEPRLSQQFASQFADYVTAVPRWLPRVRPWKKVEG